MYISQKNLPQYVASQDKRATGDLTPKAERKLNEQSEITKANTNSSTIQRASDNNS